MYRVPQPAQRAPQRAPAERRTQINFEDAVTTLQNMFGSIDRDVIRMILQANQGQMEVTVENLLQMCAPGGYTDDPNAAAPAPSQNDAEFNNSGGDGGQSANLPADFLRPPSWFRQKYPPPQTDEEAAKELERRLRDEQQADDELLAKVLQNSMFMTDLQAHPEWVTDNESEKQHQQQPPRDKGPSAISGPPVDPSDTAGRKANFREKLSALSVGARARLAGLAQRLSRNKSKNNNSSQQPRRMGGQHYQQITSLDDEPLLDDDDDVDRPFADGIELQARGGYKPPKTDDL